MLFKLCRSHLTEHKIAPVTIQYPIHPAEPLLHLVLYDLASPGLSGRDAALSSCRKHTIKETPPRLIYQASIARTSATGRRATTSPISTAPLLPGCPRTRQTGPANTVNRVKPGKPPLDGKKSRQGAPRTRRI